MNAKKIAAEKAVTYIQDGMVIGMGTGSTAAFAIQRIGERILEGLKIRAIATSKQSEDLARRWNIPLLPYESGEKIDIAIDGADEVDQQGNLIKGGGGALLREKIVAYNSKRFFVIVDHSKWVDQLGKFPLGVEVNPFGVNYTLKNLERLGARPVLRKTNQSAFITDNGNLIIDCSFYPINNPTELDKEIKAIPGVLETGLFPVSMVNMVITGYPSGEVKERDLSPHS